MYRERLCQPLEVNTDPLWQRIKAYRFDAQEHEGAFARKLARETGCSLELAGQAMEVLAVAAAAAAGRD